MSKAIKKLLKGKKVSLYQTTIANPMAAAPRLTEPDDFIFKAQLKCGAEISGSTCITDSIEKALAKYMEKHDDDGNDLVGEAMYTIEVEFTSKDVIDADVSKNGKVRFKVKDNSNVTMTIKPFKLIHVARRKDGKIGYVVRFLDDSKCDDVCFDEDIGAKKVTKIPRILVGDDMKCNISTLAADIIQYGYDHDGSDKLIDTALIKAKKHPVIIATNDDGYQLNGPAKQCLPDGSEEKVENIDITEF